MEALNLNNIWGADEMDTLFSEPENTKPEEAGEVKGNGENEEAVEASDSQEDTGTDNKTTEVNSESLFGDEELTSQNKPESVGSVKNKEGKEGDSFTDDGGGTSPNENFYSSIANAVAEDGVFPNLDEETVSKATDAESFSKLFDLEVEARLDEVQLRVKKALDNGVEPTEIRNYENTLNYISSIKESDLMAEDENGEQLRSRLIYQDFINKGIAPEKAQKLTKRSIDAGTDVEDAKEALQSNKDFFQTAYNKLLKEAEVNAEAEKAERKKQQEKLKNSILKDKDLMGDMELSQEMRKKVYDAIAKPIYRDSETGDYLTAVQKYEMENRADFLKYVGLFYSLTDGFKDFKSFTKGTVKKEVKKSLKELEQRFNSTRRNSDGSLRMVTNQREDPESFMGGNFRLAL